MTTQTTHVIDASILFRSLTNEKNDIPNKFRSFLKSRPRLVAPNLLKLEFASAARHSITDQLFTNDLLQKFGSLNIEFMDFSLTQIQKITSQAYQTKSSIYDCSYHFLAMTLNCNFLTHDKDYFKKASYLGHIELWD